MVVGGDSTVDSLLGRGQRFGWCDVVEELFPQRLVKSHNSWFL